MNNGGLDAVQLSLISGMVAAGIKIVQTANPGGIAPKTASFIALGLSLIAVAAWCASQPELPDRTWLFGLMGAVFQTTVGGLGTLVGASAIQTGGNVNVLNALSGTGSGAPSKG